MSDNRSVMMEDNSEAQMETDVSSTTTDATDMQEISGSNDVVETIIVIEKMQEDDSPDSVQQSADIENVVTNDCVQSTQPCEGTSKIQTDSLHTSITNSPQKDKQEEEVTESKVMSPSIVEMSPTKSTKSPSPTSCMENNPTNSTSPPACVGKSPIKSTESSSPVSCVEKSPTKSTSPPACVIKSPIESTKSPSPVSCVQESPNKSTKLQSPGGTSPVKIITSSMQTALEVTADSSCDLKNCAEDKILEGQEKIIQVENSATISDHQYAAKEQPEEKEQVNQPDHKAEEEKEIVEPEIVESQSKEVNIEDNKSSVKDVDNKIDESTVSSLTSEKETSIDSQNEASSDVSEKEHNRSISRELKSLIKSAKESKIISECTQLTSKTRKSRTPLDASLTSLVEADKVQGVRRSSTNSQLSTCSEKSDKANIKRSMRSQNPEFVHKDQQDGKLRSDLFCWRCHWQVEQGVNERTHHPMLCTICPRSFHYKCLSGTERNKITNDKSWVCPECLSVLNAESSDTRSPAMKKISLGMLCDLLKFALERLMDFNGAEPFMQPVDRATFPDYDKYVVHPMDLSLMKKNISEGLYGSTEAFLADTQWIFHNSIIFNTSTSKLTGHARALVRMCRTEMAEIEACPECYAAAHARRPTWFTDVCSTPHILLWAKLKGFPHWPAKAMSVNNSGLVDVRFFGAHDRAWVPSKDCYLYSEKDPNNFRTKRQDILDSMQEAELHIRNISRKYGKFVYPPFKTQFDPTKLNEQLKMMIPSFDGELSVATKEKSGGSTQSTGRDKSRSNSKSSKSSSTQDGDVSEGEEMSVTRKMADGAEIAKEEDYSINDKSMEVDMVSPKKEPSRKRRRSDLEEAVVTILSVNNSPVAEKRKRTNGEAKAIKSEEIKEKNTATDNKQIETIKDEVMDTTNNDNEPSSSTSKENTTDPTSPKIIIKVKLPKSTPKNKDKNNIEEMSTTKKQPKLDKSSNLEKDDKPKSEKRRNSKNKVLNNNGDKIIKIKQYSYEKKIDNLDKSADKDLKEDTNNKIKELDVNKTKKNIPKTNSEEQKSANAAPADDDLSLAVIARESKTNIINNNITGLPTITSVRSLLIPKSTENSSKIINTPATTTSIEITIEDTSESSIFTPTSTDNVRNMKEAVTKLQKLRNETDPPPVGRVGVRAFARMSSLEITPKEKNPIQVEIKSEPIDLDDIDRHNEKMDLMNAFKLQPVNPPVSTSLREVRINKLVVAPVNTRKSTSKPPEIRVRAKKTFPQPKKADDVRSELNGKNSMVYIPIQPPITQAPVRGVRPIVTNCLNAPNARLPAPVVTSANGVNPCPVLPFSMPSSMPKVGPATTNTCNVLSTVPTAGLNPSPVQVPTVGQVATNVHTVPLLTSLNGQWTFSLQPVMSVGGLDDSSTSVLNGMSERCTAGVSAAGAGGPLSSFPSPLALASPNVACSTPPVTSATPGSRTDTPGELPRLQQRPLLHPLDASAPLGSVPPPSTAGPLTAKLNQNAVKLTDFFRTLLEESLEKIDEPAAQATTARLQLEQTKWLHQQEISELKHNHELIVAEMRATFEKEKSRAVNEARRAAQQELEAAVKLAKSKQWCSNCSKEAQFYCCWNTSYCDYSCQRAHWSQHYSVCTQQRQDNEGMDGSPPGDGNKSADCNKPMPKSAPTAPTLAPVRVYTHEQNTQKPSIIVSMFEDSTGNQTMKCVGTYKPGPPKLSPLNVNKKVTPDDSAKKVVTSGGYLIVGGTGGPSNAITRRPPVQYYT
ncbi:PREDICTED: protein kinase C-binding protein 1-like isoform X2 [Papilio xuthus]|uniref:Protein kinase C-binding protein 1-like isoform X2 n=1 Tax=Papilio xuthus TaxID=66420 RepID=A0AAJ6Z7U5_PAPXU|nr:PREDICTED: protein kinase C-binding protein 1-like isoform X2 [Papilio xuthus]